MKNKLLLFVFSFVLTGSISAKFITKSVVESQLPVFAPEKGFTITARSIINVEPYVYKGQITLYAVNFLPEGWMLVPADDAITPVIAYSRTGSFSFKSENSDSFLPWINLYAGQVYETIQDTKSQPNSRWYHTESFRKTKSADIDEILPLISVKFNQSAPWNKYCPSSSAGTALVGCVAVAMAQAMTVCKYPVRPNGTFSYSSPGYGNLYVDYNAESPYNWDMIISGDDGKDAAAHLLYQCGVAVMMDYGVSGSGTQTSYIPAALIRNFGYPNSVKVYSRDSYGSGWLDLINNELKNGRAVVYSGYDGTNTGHAFNLDGYEGGMYHVNWGWAGNSNGYYTIDGLIAGGGNYTKGQQVVVGIRAPSEGPQDIVLSKISVPANQPVGTIVGSVSIESEAASPNYSFSLKGGYSVIKHGYLSSSFYIEDGYLKTSAVFSADDESVPVTITVTNTNNGLSYEKTFEIKVTTGGTTDVFPLNVNSRKFYVSNSKVYVESVDFENAKYSLYSVTGSQVADGMLKMGQNSIFSQKLSGGVYILNVVTLAGTVERIKIIYK